jgi:hypothetical protein
VLSGEKNVSIDTNSYSSGASESVTSVEVSVGVSVSVCRLQVQEIAAINITEISANLIKFLIFLFSFVLIVLYYVLFGILRGI